MYNTNNLQTFIAIMIYHDTHEFILMNKQNYCDEQHSLVGPSPQFLAESHSHLFLVPNQNSLGL